MTARTTPMTAPAAATPASSDAPPPASPSDDELIELLRDGSSQAGEALVRRYYQPLMRYLHRLAGSDHVAEELHQQTWLSVLDHMEKFEPGTTGGGGFKGWLFRIATNKANDHWRAV